MLFSKCGKLYFRKLTETEQECHERDGIFLKLDNVVFLPFFMIDEIRTEVRLVLLEQRESETNQKGSISTSKVLFWCGVF